ncbi:UNKNOWN [Stylonychia lemnae]|uniref:Uncharacterized protein n=1 Tax=Stylonychia lemnae TaxID=5949 RepID=A0A077ZXQ5_STYLE|nr:UNKNOWN [Stylonychia lemnae]|eukprot:CDW74357.1 UNKNOWN [Stylonychia lemnae]
MLLDDFYAENRLYSTDEDDIFMRNYLTYMKDVLIMDDYGAWSDKQRSVYYEYQKDKDSGINRTQLYNDIVQELKKAKVANYLDYICEFKDFNIWMSIEVTRAYQVKLSDYLQLRKEKYPNDQDQYLLQYQKYYGNHTIVLLPIADMINGLIKGKGQRDATFLFYPKIFRDEPYLQFAVKSTFNVGEEFIYTYMPDQSQKKLLMSYGMAVDDNYNANHHLIVDHGIGNLVNEYLKLCQGILICIDKEAGKRIQSKEDSTDSSNVYILNKREINPYLYNLVRAGNMQKYRQKLLRNDKLMHKRLSTFGYFNMRNEMNVVRYLIQIYSEEYLQRFAVQQLNKEIQTLERTDGIWQNEDLRRKLIVVKATAQTQQVIQLNMKYTYQRQASLILRLVNQDLIDENIKNMKQLLNMLILLIFFLFPFAQSENNSQEDFLDFFNTEG